MNTDLSITGDGKLSGANPKEKLRAVAKQFEGVFLNQLLSRLDQGSFVDSPLVGGSNASKQFSELFHQALGEKAAGSLGVADAIYDRLSVHLRNLEAAAHATTTTGGGAIPARTPPPDHADPATGEASL